MWCVGVGAIPKVQNISSIFVGIKRAIALLLSVCILNRRFIDANMANAEAQSSYDWPREPQIKL